MKKILCAALLACCSFIAMAQITYTPFIPNRSDPITLDWGVPAKPNIKPSVKIISTDVITTTAIDLQKESVCLVQVKQEVYSNDQINQEIIGIKYSDQWQAMHAPVKYIADLLSSADTDTDEKNALLLCNELATHIAVDEDRNIYLLGIRED